MNLHLFVAKHLCGWNLSHASFFWDITKSSSLGQPKKEQDQGTTGCLMTHTTLYSTLRERPVLGLENMLLQGFPLCLSYESLSDAELRCLAGNAIYVPIIAMLQLAALVHIDLDAVDGEPPGRHHNTSDEMLAIPGSTWAGPKTTSEMRVRIDSDAESGSFDKLPGCEKPQPVESSSRKRAKPASSGRHFATRH